MKKYLLLLKEYIHYKKMFFVFPVTDNISGEEFDRVKRIFQGNFKRNVEVKIGKICNAIYEL